MGDYLMSMEHLTLLKTKPYAFRDCKKKRVFNYLILLYFYGDNSNDMFKKKILDILAAGKVS